jgi:hypothetical protein
MGATYDLGELVDSIIEGRAVAFMGAGTSASARLPDWPALLKQLIDTGAASSCRRRWG